MPHLLRNVIYLGLIVYLLHVAAIWVFILVALDMCIDIYIYTASIIVMCCLVLCRVLGCCGVINDYNLKSNLNYL